MGIRGAWTTFRTLFKSMDPIDLQPLKIGIDMFSLVYTHRTNLSELLDLLKSWSVRGHTLICIWDGNAPKEKQEIIGQRRSARESAMGTKQELEHYLEQFENQLNESDIKHLKTAITSLSWQGWHLTGSLKKKINETLGDKIKHIYAEGEADDLLIKMATEKSIDVILSLDSDLFAMGGERIWRVLRIRKQWIIEDISVEEVCNNWGISLGSLQDACFLAGWDRCHLTGTTYMPFISALNRIKHYQSINLIVQKFLPGCTIDTEALGRLAIIKKESRDRWHQILKQRSSHSISPVESRASLVAEVAN